MVAGVVIDERCIMRCILSSLDRAGSPASEKEGLQEVEVFQVEGWSVQVRARLIKQLVLFGPQSQNVDPHCFRRSININQSLTLHPAEMSAHRRPCAADDFSDASMRQARDSCLIREAFIPVASVC